MELQEIETACLSPALRGQLHELVMVLATARFVSCQLSGLRLIVRIALTRRAPR
ncbi:hypothetical protein [Lentzea sp. CA-135723]|uniref:hypothetical protein n=1 Tax=Lentzea sp. CA-135723 TaxID=3239950 RepID=UPI003D8A7D54